MSDYSYEFGDFDNEIEKDMNIGKETRENRRDRKTNTRNDSSSVFDMAERDRKIKELDDISFTLDFEPDHKKYSKDVKNDKKKKEMEDINLLLDYEKDRKIKDGKHNVKYEEISEFEIDSDFKSMKDGKNKQNEMLFQNNNDEFEDSHFLSLDGENKFMDMKPMKQDDSIISDISYELTNENILKIFEYLEGDKKKEEKLIKRLTKFEEKLDKKNNKK